jgi:uncharacterized membrane protein YfcA
MLGLEVLLGGLIGVLLGGLGGGGSILTVPALVYVLGQSPQAAVTASLLIVGSNSAFGAMLYTRTGCPDWRVALTFGGVGMVAAFFTAQLSALFSSQVLMSLFAGLMLVIGLAMLLRRNGRPSAGLRAGWPVVLASGAVVGAITGFLGVGGGFLIVPALVMLVGMPMQQAVGTSLIVIAMNSLAGIAGHWGDALPDLGLIGVFTGAGFVGIWAGKWLNQRLPTELLKRGFAVFVIGLAVVLLADNLFAVG